MRAVLYTSAAVLALLVIPAAASAADMSVKAPPPAPIPPLFSWSGFYIGGNLGGAWANRDVTDSLFGLNFDDGNNDNGVFIGGGQVGANYQFGNIVIGVEGDFDWAANNNNTTGGVVIPTVGTIQVAANDRWVATVAGRLGYAADRWLIYGKAGGGWVGANNFTVTNVTTGASFTGSNTNTDSGWLVGGGVEWAFAENWSVRAEYDYLGLSNRTFTVPVGTPFLAGDTFTSGNRNVQMATVGLNYRFDWGGRY